MKVLDDKACDDGWKAAGEALKKEVKKICAEIHVKCFKNGFKAGYEAGALKVMDD